MRFSKYVTSRRMAPKSVLSSAMGVLLLSSASSVSAAAATTPEQSPDGDDGASRKQLETVEVHGHLTKQLPSPKYTAPLLDTPQTITVVPKAVIDGQNLQRLQDILTTLPGITFGAGEGGGGYGDSINLRGFSGSNDITSDGVRDSAQYTRTDTFNLEQVELINGANSASSGAGSVGGSINLVSKVAGKGDATKVSAGLGTDNYRRVTLDSNQDFDNGMAVRLNIMGHGNDVPGRDFEKYQRWGFAPSVAFGLGSATRLTLSFLHQKDNNLPQYGVPYFRNAFNDGALPGVDPSNYYGYRNVDRQDIKTDMLTAVLNHEFTDNFSIRNLSRASQTDQTTVVDAVQGTWCLPNNLTPAGLACTSGTGAALIVVPVGSYLPSGPRGLQRDTRNKILFNQTDLTSTFNTGAMGHTLVAGLALTRESFDLNTGTQFRNADGSNPYVAPGHLPFMDLYRPDSVYTGPRNYFRTGRTTGELDNASVYLFDTIKFSEQWLLNLGARYERNDGSSTTYNVAAAGPTIGQVTGLSPGFPASNQDNLFSYRAGVIFKPVENASLYLSYGNSKTPSKASVNGSCTPVTTPGTAHNCNVDPESAANFELGGKWDLFDESLSLTASVFRNERSNYKVADPLNPNNPSGEQQLDGKARVDGVTVGVSGKLTDAWSVFANYTRLDSEVLQSVSDFVAQGTGIDAQKGNPLTNTPKNAMSLWTTYVLGSWTLGYGATYSGEYYLNNSGPTLFKAPDYWTHRAMLGWRVNRNFDLQLNVQNLADKEFYTRIRNNGWAVPGETRTYMLTANYSF